MKKNYVKLLNLFLIAFTYGLPTYTMESSPQMMIEQITEIIKEDQKEKTATIAQIGPNQNNNNSVNPSTNNPPEILGPKQEISYKEAIKQVATASIELGSTLYNLSHENNLNTAMIYLEASNGKHIPLPVHFTSKQFQQKIKSMSVKIDGKKTVIECLHFSFETLNLISKILTHEAGRSFTKSTRLFPEEKIQQYLSSPDENETIQKAKNLLWALKFFLIKNPYFEMVLTKCQTLTGYHEEELIFLQADLIDQLKNNNMGALDKAENNFYDQVPSPGTQDAITNQLYWLFNVSPKTKRFIAFELIKEKIQSVPFMPMVDPRIIDKDTSDELDIMSGSGSTDDHYFAHSIDRTYSEVGKVLLYSKLLQPTDDKNEIEKNQNKVNFLLKNGVALEKVDAAFSQFFTKSQNENVLLSFFSSNNPANASYTDQVQKDPLVIRWLNSSETIESVKGLPNQISLWTQSFITEKTDYVHKEYPLLSQFSPSLLTYAFYIPGTLLSGRTAQAVAFALAAQFTEKIVSGTHLPSFVKKLIQDETSDLIGTFLKSTATPNTGKNVLGHFNAHKFLHEKVAAMAQLIETVEQINQELKKIPEIIKILPCLKDLDLSKQSNAEAFKLFNPRTWQDPASFDQFIDKIGSKFFTEKDNAWIKTGYGRIIATHYLMYLHREKLLNMYMALAELDVYLSLARLYKEHKDTPHPYHFVTLAASDKPLIQFEGLWNPMLRDEAVSNDIMLGGNNPKDAIITGPNTGGKSTLIRSIVFGILMAQSFGLCPAEKAVITPFSNIRAYANITDDQANKRSLFKVSTERAAELLKTAKKPGHSFISFDEIYNGTQPWAASSLAYATLKFVAENYPNNICIASTHYPCVVDLRKELDTHFAYLRVCDEQTDRYKVVRGIYTDCNSFEVAEDTNIYPKIIQDARNHYEDKKDETLQAHINYLDDLRYKEPFDNFIEKLSKQEKAKLKFFHKIALTSPCNETLFKLALMHKFDVKKLINHQDAAGRTILHHLALEDIRNKDLIDFLLNNGAAKEVRDNKGKKPIDYALAMLIKTKLKEASKNQ